MVTKVLNKFRPLGAITVIYLIVFISGNLFLVCFLHCLFVFVFIGGRGGLLVYVFLFLMMGRIIYQNFFIHGRIINLMQCSKESETRLTHGIDRRSQS